MRAGEDVNKYLEDIKKHAFAQREAAILMKEHYDGSEQLKRVNKAHEELRWLTNQLGILHERFGPYMNFSRKFPSKKAQNIQWLPPTSVCSSELLATVMMNRFDDVLLRVEAPPGAGGKGIGLGQLCRSIRASRVERVPPGSCP
jgi:hypothetical protein